MDSSANSNELSRGHLAPILPPGQLPGHPPPGLAPPGLAGGQVQPRGSGQVQPRGSGQVQPQGYGQVQQPRAPRQYVLGPVTSWPRLTVIPPTPGRVRTGLQTDAMRFALTRTSGREDCLDTRTMVEGFKKCDLVKHGLPEVDMEKKIEEFAVAAVDNDVVVIRAPHLYGKTTMMPLIARMAFVKSMEDQNLHSGSAKKSDKLLYIDTEVNALYSLKKHFKKVYPQLQCNIYNDVGCGNPTDSARRSDDSNPVKFPECNKSAGSLHAVDIILATPAAALPMIEYGHFGMVVLDNVHRVGNWDLFDAVVTGVLRGMFAGMTRGENIECRRFGRLFFLTDDAPGANKYLDQALEKMGRSTISVKEFEETCVYENPRRVNKSCLAGDWPGWPQHPIMPLAEKKGITAHMLNHNLPIFVNAISTHERESSRNVRLEDSNVPDAMFIKACVVSVAEATIEYEEYLAMMNIGQTTDLTDRHIGTIMVVCPGKEAVSAITKAIRNLKIFNISDTTGPVKVMDTAMEYTRISFDWRFDTVVCDEAGLLNPELYKSFSGRIYKGLMVVCTEEVGGLLEVPRLSTIIFASNTQRSSSYRSHGLRKPISEFADSKAIRQLCSRMDRENLTVPDEVVVGRFMYAGSQYELMRQRFTDNRLNARLNRRTMVDIVLDQARHSDDIPMYTSPYINVQAMKDAHKTGVINMISDRNEYQIPEATKGLMLAFPDLTPQSAMLVVLGAKYGVLRHAMILAALEVCRDRVYQQSIKIDNNYYDPWTMHDIFSIVVSTSMNHGMLMSSPQEYESEAVCVADVLASLLQALQWSSSPPEHKTYNDIASMSAPPENFFGCDWCDGTRQLFGGRWASVPLDVKRKFEAGLNFQGLMGMFIKEEGRTAMEQALLCMSRVVESIGLTTRDPIGHGGHGGSGHSCKNKYNRYLFGEKSPLLSDKGRNILSALITMCSSQFGEFTQAYSLPAENSRSGMDEEQPPRYVVKDDREGGFLKVHGFRTWRPEAPRVYASYWSSDCYPGRSRFHSRVHPVSLGQIAVFGNCFGLYDIGSNDKGEAVMELHLTGSFHYLGGVEIKSALETMEYVAVVRGVLRHAFVSVLECPAVNTTAFEEYLSQLWSAFYRV